MKGLKACIRVLRLEEVLSALQEAGARDITVIRVDDAPLPPSRLELACEREDGRH